MRASDADILQPLAFTDEWPSDVLDYLSTHASSA